MLVLSRNVGKRVLIGSNIEIMVVEARGDRIKLGFECPRDVRVLREELQWHPVLQDAQAHMPNRTHNRWREYATAEGA